jgi:hypothetical protein
LALILYRWQARAGQRGNAIVFYMASLFAHHWQLLALAAVAFEDITLQSEIPWRDEEAFDGDAPPPGAVPSPVPSRKEMFFLLLQVIATQGLA